MKKQEADHSAAPGYTGGGGIRVLLYLFLVPIVLFIVALFLLLVPLPSPFPPAASSARNLPVAILTGLSGIAFVCWIACSSLSRIRKASRRLDPVLRKRGFRLGNAYAFARTFQGTYQGLRIHGDLFPDYKLQPWRFSVQANAIFALHAVFSNRQPITHTHKLARCSAGGAWHSIFIYCNQPDALTEVLNSHDFAQSVDRIRKTLSPSDTWQIIVQPQEAQLRVMSYRLCSESVEIWLDEFYRLLSTLSDLTKR